MVAVSELWDIQNNFNSPSAFEKHSHTPREDELVHTYFKEVHSINNLYSHFNIRNTTFQFNIFIIYAEEINEVKYIEKKNNSKVGNLGQAIVL